MVGRFLLQLLLLFELGRLLSIVRLLSREAAHRAPQFKGWNDFWLYLFLGFVDDLFAAAFLRLNLVFMDYCCALPWLKQPINYSILFVYRCLSQTFYDARRHIGLYLSVLGS